MAPKRWFHDIGNDEGSCRTPSSSTSYCLVLSCTKTFRGKQGSSVGERLQLCTLIWITLDDHLLDTWASIMWKWTDRDSRTTTYMPAILQSMVQHAFVVLELLEHCSSLLCNGRSCTRMAPFGIEWTMVCIPCLN